MARPKVFPRDHERKFEFNELFFSITDPKGVILSGNEVFARVAGFASVNELIGQPHNIVRHPDMPRAVFKLMWSTLKAGKPFAGYVKNLATDGGYYWVMALVVPIASGFLSIRFKPSSPYFNLIKEVYAELLAIEAEPSDDAPDAWREKMLRSEQHLGALLTQAGFGNYTEFMHASLALELESRRTKFEQNKVDSQPAYNTAEMREIAERLQTCETIEKQLDELFLNAVSFLQLIQSLDTKSSFLSDLAHKLHFVSLNGVVSSEHLGKAGMALAEVTRNLTAIAKESKDVIAEMIDQHKVTAPLRATAFAITSAKLQVEMAIFFAKELLQVMANDAGLDADEDALAANVTTLRNDLKTLVHSFEQSTLRMLETLPQAQESIARRVQLSAKLNRVLRSLAIARVTGKVQAIQVTGADFFLGFFEEIAAQVSLAKAELSELDRNIPYLQAHLPRFRSAGGAVQHSLAAFH